MATFETRTLPTDVTNAGATLILSEEGLKFVTDDPHYRAAISDPVELRRLQTLLGDLLYAIECPAYPPRGGQRCGLRAGHEGPHRAEFRDHDNMKWYTYEVTWLGRPVNDESSDCAAAEPSA